MALKIHWADLHIHTVLSPCAEVDMGAPDVVERARQLDIDVISITDHNSAANAEAFQQASLAWPRVIAGLEVQTMEDVHIVTLFESAAAASAFQSWLWQKMGTIRNEPETFGLQLIIDKDNNILGEEETLLIQAADYTTDQVVRRAKEMNGLVILAHLDRGAYSYSASLGPVPDSLPVDALELSPRAGEADWKRWRALYPNRIFVRSSDSHTLQTMSRENCTPFLIEKASFAELAMAFRGENGRRVLDPWTCEPQF